MNDILRVEDVPTKRTSIFIKDKRYGTGQKIIWLGNVTIEEIQKELKKSPRAFQIIIGGWIFSIDSFEEFIKNGEAHWFR